MEAFTKTSCTEIQALLPTNVEVEGFPGGSDSKASVYNAGDLGSIPGSRRFPGEGISRNPHGYGVTKSRT